MKKSSIRLIALILAIVVFAGAFYIYQYKPFAKEADLPAEAQGAKAGPPAAQPAGMMGGPTPVRAIIIEAGPMTDALSVNGSTMPESEVTITTEVPGKITSIMFKEGTLVKRGTPLVKLDDEELQAQRDRLLVRQALTQKIAERLKGLYEKEGVSLQEYEIAAAEAKQVTAEINLIDVQLQKRTIRAPFSGVLGLRQVSEGTYVSPGTAVVNLVNTDPINIEFSVPEKYANTLARGSMINFVIDGMEGIFRATVIAKEPNIEPTTRTMKLKASASNPNGRILPGAFAAVTVNLRTFERTIMVPTEAIVPELGGKKVFVFRNGQAEAVPVETGVRKESMIQIIKGLEPGDTLITTGVLQIRAGAPVTITQLDQAEQG